MVTSSRRRDATAKLEASSSSTRSPRRVLRLPSPYRRGIASGKTDAPLARRKVKKNAFTWYYVVSINEIYEESRPWDFQNTVRYHLTRNIHKPKLQPNRNRRARSSNNVFGIPSQRQESAGTPQKNKYRQIFTVQYRRSVQKQRARRKIQSRHSRRQNKIT